MTPALSDLCDRFQVEAEALDPAADDTADELRGLIHKLARDAADHVADYGLGEVPALMRRCREALAALAAEVVDAEDAGEDRRRRYDRRQAVLNLLVFCEGVRRFHASKGKPDDLTEFRGQVADALADLVERAERT